MKKTLLIVLPLLLIVGCSKPLDDESLIDRGGVKYQQDSQKPYSGKVFSLYGNGEKKLEGSYKDGKQSLYCNPIAHSALLLSSLPDYLI